MNLQGEKKIKLVNLQKKFKTKEPHWQQVVNVLAQKTKAFKRFEAIHVVLVGEQRMRALKKKFFGKSVVSDVLAFALDEALEIVICPMQCKRQALLWNVSCQEEMLRLVIHGMLHSLGFDDRQEGDRKKMWETQEQLVIWTKKQGLPWKKLIA